MKPDSIGRERVVWMAVVGVLMSALAWLGVINLGLLFASADGVIVSTGLVLFRALLRAAWALLAGAWTLIPAGILVTALVIVAARTSPAGSSLDRGVRHV